MSAASHSVPGTLVSARDREWVVLPGSTDELLLVRPVDGLDEETTGILPAAESVSSTTFPLPTASDVGDFSSGYLLRESARLSTRAAAGPFRSFGRIAVDPRPYQLVPLIMALRLDPVRLLIADDVGIGKTIEAGLIVRELLDRGEIRRFTVLCPPHLADQWRRELSEKFHLDVEPVLGSTILRLERDLPTGVGVFDQHPHTVVSMDFIKNPSRAHDFATKCPELVVVDEAHGCAPAGGASRGRQQRHELLKRIAQDGSRHILLLTATPHSGNEDAFRSLLGLVNGEFAVDAEELSQEDRANLRRRISRHLVQRRRQDIRDYLKAETTFPKHESLEVTYRLSKPYRDVLFDILAYTSQYVATSERQSRQRRVRHWSALALLRCVSSSPAAAIATLKKRSGVCDVADADIDEKGEEQVLDQAGFSGTGGLDYCPGSDDEAEDETHRRKLREFAARIKGLPPEADQKLVDAIKAITTLLDDGYEPIVFCRFVDTVEYVANALRSALSGKAVVESVTATLPPGERETRIAEFAQKTGPHVLVCSDCLSEGINLQEHFNAVFHYDLAWNPTRHEQREGRVDRFRQPRPWVRVVTYYGTDNPIDGVILDVLIRKHENIKNALGVSIAVPGSSEDIVDALFAGTLFRERMSAGSGQLSLDLAEEFEPMKRQIHRDWEEAGKREKTNRSIFAQNAIRPEAVAAELESVRAAIGGADDVRQFFHSALSAAQVPVSGKNGTAEVHLSNETPRALRQAIGREEGFVGRFALPVGRGEVYLGRTSPVIEGLASWALGQALGPASPDEEGRVARCGVICTGDVKERTTLLVVRFRYRVGLSSSPGGVSLCEEMIPLACTGPPENPAWVSDEQCEALLRARPTGNPGTTRVNQQIDLVVKRLPTYRDRLAEIAGRRSVALGDAHQRVRSADRRAATRPPIEPVLPADILGGFVLLVPIT